MRFFSKHNMLRLGLAIVSVALIALVVPRNDHQSFSYELNQPWKYPLLTAAFDTPILRDSASAASLKDSIDASFIPFVKRDESIAASNETRFSNMISHLESPAKARVLTMALKEAYRRGIVDAGIYDFINNDGPAQLRRTVINPEGETYVETVDASGMLSPAAAFAHIDSVLATSGLPDVTLSDDEAKALNICLVPSIVIDTAVDSKYRNQEYLDVTAAQGVIKKGQRIVDVGEIITPQIFTNLNTYQEMLMRRDAENGPELYYTVGQVLYICIVIMMLYLFMRLYRPRFFSDIKKMTFLMLLITAFSIFAILMQTHVRYGLYMVPFAAVPVLMLVFFDSRSAIAALAVTILIAAMVSTTPLRFIMLELSAGLAATYSIHQLSKRSQLLRAGALSFIAYILVYVVVTLMLQGNLQNFTWRLISSFAINAVLLSFAYVLVVVIERTFGFTSTVTLVELSDINNPLLRRLAEEAPGTFQHSMQVSTLAAEAARAIGVNTQLVRTGALYHDIGKIESPVFFTENQHGVNPHAGLSPQISARKIISHVTNGLQMASKEKLPQVIRDFISEHHGKGITRYFYNTAVNENPDIHIDREDFTYPGPNPQSKETAILMMADSVEAASRSLKEYTHESIGALVDKIVDSQVAEGLLKDSPISLRDIETVKDTFKKRLATIYHSRVAYPELQAKPK